MMRFEDLKISPLLVKALEEIGFETPTPIQEETIPYLIETKKDLIALAQTGTGKTAAFALPIIDKIQGEIFHTQALILCPTRELSLQIEKEFIRFIKYFPLLKVVSIYGGGLLEGQLNKLKQGAHIIIATPGRLLDLIKRKKIKLSNLRYLVLDEADEMLNMGFKEELDNIISYVPEKRQTLLFSATMPKAMELIAQAYLKDPKRIVIDKGTSSNNLIEHAYYVVKKSSDKYRVLRRIIDNSPGIYGIIFCRTKLETKEISNKLIREKYQVEALSGDLSQAQRELIMKRFRDKSIMLIVATDVAARGIDIEHLSHVINYHLPDDDIYIHRSGRTGRAGRSGVSYSILEPRELRRIKTIEARLKCHFENLNIPKGEEICQKQVLDFIKRLTDVSYEEEGFLGNDFFMNLSKDLDFLDKESLLKKICFLNFKNLFDYYSKNKIDTFNTKEVDVSPTLKKRRKESVKSLKTRKEGLFSKIKLSLGTRDNLSKIELIRMINKLVRSKSFDIGHIEISSSHSFFEIETKVKRKILKALEHAKFQGKEFTCKVIA